MFSGIFTILYSFINELVSGTIDILINPAVTSVADKGLTDFNINIVLFSDTSILATNLYDLTSLFFTFFYSVFFIVLLYKVTKKVIRSIFGVLKWW